MLARDEIDALLRELGAELDAHGVHGEMFVVGGGVTALAYNTRRATQDLDAVFEPKQVIYEAAERVGEPHGLPPGWLNDAVKGFLPGADPNATVYFDEPGLAVRVASPRYLFAMKVAAARVERDEDDLRVLYDLCGFRSADDALDSVVDLYPDITLAPRSELLVREIAG